MRALVLGCGSIGRRHAANLRDLGLDIVVSDTDRDRAEAVAREIGAIHVDRNSAPPADVVVVATPSDRHVADLEWALDRGSHVFVEKPVGVSASDVLRVRELEGRPPGFQVMVGCNLRFTDGFAALSELLPEVGRMVALLIDFGWWLPAWRPGTDYRVGYSASRAQGGGIILDAIHELDYALALAGPAVDVTARWVASGALEVDVEDVADVIVRHATGVQSSIHVDYLRRVYSRTCSVIGTRGTLTWDFTAGRVELTTEPTAPPKRVAAGLDADRNAQYVAEMRHFLAAVTSGSAVVNGLAEAAATLELAVTALDRGAMP